MDKLTLLSNLRSQPPQPCTRPEFLPAGVLLPVYPGPDGQLSVCLIRRPQGMRHHPGQIAFPGGKPEAGDPDLGFTALRETHEELGIEPARVELLACLDEVWVPSGYRLVPWVGWLDALPALQPSPSEVDLVLHPTVETLLAPATFREEEWGRDERKYRMVFFDVENGPIWGATARILFRFLQLGFGWRADDQRPWEYF